MVKAAAVTDEDKTVNGARGSEDGIDGCGSGRCLRAEMDNREGSGGDR